MNKYEYLMQQYEMCEMMAGLYAEADDVDLTAFYFNAAVGFKKRAESLKLNETHF